MNPLDINGIFMDFTLHLYLIYLFKMVIFYSYVNVYRWVNCSRMHPYLVETETWVSSPNLLGC